MAALLVVVSAACGGDDSSDGGDSDSTAADTAAEVTTAVPTTVASWASAADILTGDAIQALPPLDGFADALRAENQRIGATDGLDHDVDDAGQGLTFAEGTCTEVGYISYFYEADVALTESPDVGIIAPSVQVYVCPDEAALAERAAGMFDIHGGSEGVVCDVDDVGPDGLGTRVCASVTNSGTLNWYNAASLGAVDLALVAVTGDLGTGTDTADGAAAMEALLDYSLAHLAERIG